MTANRLFWLILLGLAVVVCSVGLFVGWNSDVNSIVQNDSENDEIVLRFEQQVFERSQQYLDSVRRRSADLPANLRAKIESQAQNTVGKGLAKLNRSAELVQIQAEAADFAVISEALRKIEQNSAQGSVLSSALNTAEFLCRDFHRPTELEVAVCVAVPSWNRLQNGMFTAQKSHRLFGTFGLDPASCNAVVVPTTPRNLKSLIQLLGQLSVSVSAAETDPVFRRHADEILPSFTLIAQTVIRRE